jgi:hypothetical protein
VNFGKRQKAMPVAAIIDESRLKRWFDPGYLCEVDIAFELLVLGRFKIEFLNPVSCYDCDPGFFPVTRVDKHTRCHVIYSSEHGSRLLAEGRSLHCWYVAEPDAKRSCRQSDMVGMIKMRLLLVHGGRVSRALDFQPMRHALTGRRWWKYHASCSVNLLNCRA